MRDFEHRLTVRGDVPVVLRAFEPAEQAQAAVIIPSAMGVAQKYYADFARWLAARGYFVVTFDYRGIGKSAPRSLRGFDIDLLDWAREDCAAVIEFVTTRLPQTPLHWIGHSLGGQLLGLIPNRERIDSVVTVATGSGYWLENSWPTRRMVWWLWFVAVPLATRVAGYFPGRRLRKVGDLPRGVIERWRRWCLSREYMVGVEGDGVRAAYASVRTPMLALSFTDDEMMSDRSTRSMHALYSSAPIEHRRIAPREIGVQRIGHFGFFRSQFEATLWQQVLQWLASSARTASSPGHR